MLTRGSAAKAGFAGNVAIVTGASGGIGQELARQLAASATHVGLLARRRAALEELAGSIETAGGVALPVPADVTESRTGRIGRGIGSP